MNDGVVVCPSVCCCCFVVAHIISLFLTIRYERMDEHMPTAFGECPTEQRYEVPESSLADTPKVWGPYFLGVYDLANIKESGALFVRKVSVHVDRNIVDMLPVENIDELPSISWPNELQISESPDFEVAD